MQKITKALGMLLVLTLLVSGSAFAGINGVEETLLPSEATNKLNADFDSFAEYVRGRMKPKEGVDFKARMAEHEELQGKIWAQTQKEDLNLEESWTLVSLAKYTRKLNEIDSVKIAKEVAYANMDGSLSAASIYLNDLFMAETTAAEYAKVFESLRDVFATDTTVNKFYQPAIGIPTKLLEEGKIREAGNYIVDVIKTVGIDKPYSVIGMLGQDSQMLISALGKEKYTALLTAKIAEIEAIVTDDNKRSWGRILSNLKKADAELKAGPVQVADLELTKLLNTDAKSYADFKGKVLLLDFWANWCGPCKAGFPHLRELRSHFDSKKFEILGVTALQGNVVDYPVSERGVTPEREYELTAEMVTRHEMTWPVVFISKKSLKDDYQVSAFPTFILVDQQGNQVLRASGMSPLTTAFLEYKIKELTTKKAAKKASRVGGRRASGVSDEFIEFSTAVGSKEWQKAKELYPVAQSTIKAEYIMAHDKRINAKTAAYLEDNYTSRLAVMVAKVYKALGDQEAMLEAHELAFSKAPRVSMGLTTSRAEPVYAQALLDAGQPAKALEVITPCALLGRIPGAGAIMLNAYYQTNDSLSGYLEYKAEMLEKLSPEASDFTLKDYEGNEVSLSDYKGKVIFLDFWYTRCGPCLHSMKKLKDVYPELKKKGVVFLFVEAKNDPEGAKKIIAKNGYTYDFIRDDKERSVTSLYGISVYPTAFFIDKSFKIKTVYFGSPNIEQYLKDLKPLM